MLIGHSPCKSPPRGSQRRGLFCCYIPFCLPYMFISLSRSRTYSRTSILYMSNGGSFRGSKLSRQSGFIERSIWQAPSRRAQQIELLYSCQCRIYAPLICGLWWLIRQLCRRPLAHSGKCCLCALQVLPCCSSPKAFGR